MIKVLLIFGIFIIIAGEMALAAPQPIIYLGSILPYIIPDILPMPTTSPAPSTCNCYNNEGWCKKKISNLERK